MEKTRDLGRFTRICPKAGLGVERKRWQINHKGKIGTRNGAFVEVVATSDKSSIPLYQFRLTSGAAVDSKW